MLLKNSAGIVHGLIKVWGVGVGSFSVTSETTGISRGVCGRVLA